MKQVISFFYLVLIVFSVDAQITLSGTNYSQNFDGVGSGLPSGFRVSSSATAATLGTDFALAGREQHFLDISHRRID